jgi:hypothetical protein
MLRKSLHYLYFSPNIVRVVKPWRLRWPTYAVCVGEMGCTRGILFEKPARSVSALRIDIGVMISSLNSVDIAMHNGVMGFRGRSVESN